MSFLRREIISNKWLKINSAMTHDLSLFIKSEHIIKYKYIWFLTWIMKGKEKLWNGLQKIEVIFWIIKLFLLSIFKISWAEIVYSSSKYFDKFIIPNAIFSVSTDFCTLNNSTVRSCFFLRIFQLYFQIKYIFG